MTSPFQDDTLGRIVRGLQPHPDHVIFGIFEQFVEEDGENADEKGD